MAKQQTMDAIEHTIDAVEDTAQTLERIPKVNLNGTTKNQQVLILATVAVVSAAAGVATTIAVMKGKLRLRRRDVTVVEPVIEKK